MAKGFTLVEVIISMVIFSFVALVAVDASGSGDYLVERSNQKKDTINLMSVVLLSSLDITKDEKRADEYITDIILDDKIKKYLKDIEVKYDKETIVPASEFIPSLVQIQISSSDVSSFVYYYE